MQKGSLLFLLHPNFLMAHASPILLLFLLLSLQVIAQENETNIIKPGSSLYPRKHPSSWASSSGHFEFGFYPQGSGFSVGIWLVGQPENTIVWTANRGDPPVSSNATLVFTGQGGLLLQTENGKENLIVDVRESVDSASMLDTGNFVFFQNRSVVWESFDSPTDTILGGQNLSTNYNLTSSVSRSNHSTGQYYLIMQGDGNLVAYVRSAAVDTRDAYWATNTYGSSLSRLYLNERGRLLLYAYPEERGLANSSQIGDKTVITYRATLDPDGVFRIYSHQFESNISSNGTKEWQNLNDLCDVKGNCGLNSYCSSRNNDVECYCYPGFTFINENRKFLGCSQNFTLDGCEARKDLVMHYNFTTLENMDWVGSGYSLMNMNEEDCKKACEEDCYCGGALYSRSSGSCTRYSLPLIYGKRRGDISTTAFIKLILGSTPTIPPPQSPTLIDEGNQRLISTMGLSLGSVSCLCFVIAISSFLIYRHRMQSYRKLLENKNSGFTEQFTLRSFSFSELDKATDGFKDELGRGSFGVVYKGILPGDKDSKTVAVKKLEKVKEGEREFRTEMAVIGRTNHRNLVRLLGFCVEGSRKLLVYEYLSNGSLANFLFNTSESPNWKERARIALDVAKGILYLHEECEVCIIHCNIKPQNILLDDSMTAKISDFGLAKLLRPNQTSISGIIGTAGHLAPEWQRNASLSVKADVYSFGVILLEIICCRSSIDVEVSNADEILLSTWVYNCFAAGELNQLVGGEEVDLRMLERFVKVGLWCIQDDPTLRPLVKNVTLMLEGKMDVPVPPFPSLSHVTY
ncbi:PREDICTED: G-type lectin S-receptor-like serine/threonine-protein kinase LECRK1 [Theobroma cacao]|uniref:Receptor-like serine/threonine-protein kinase n=2 Tax=Theobroma cacao TaxID=3641 RepID=A0A061DR44_THECC|nr:PREDICTED: G-type lectin S-receptor-like serine/threonine-protein kinase LECRK1 [Theobroma cacao]EOX92433.1 Receptor-like protein kinase 1, putative [Theobroma cacao]